MSGPQNPNDPRLVRLFNDYKALQDQFAHLIERAKQSEEEAKQIYNNSQQLIADSWRTIAQVTKDRTF